MSNHKSQVRNIADEDQVKEATKKEEFLEERRIGELLWVMDSAIGRRFMRRLIVDICGAERNAYLTPMVGRGSDPVFVMGHQNVGQNLLEQLKEHCPEKWLLMEAEYIEEKKKERVNG
jgi:hypothetical protein